MRVELAKDYTCVVTGRAMGIFIDAIPRIGETIIFNREEDATFLSEFYEENEEQTPELIVSDVIYSTGGNVPVILLKKLTE